MTKITSDVKQLDALATMGEGLKKKRKTPRQKFDLYETPEAITNDLLKFYDLWFGSLYDSSFTIFEPCVGNGAILKPLKEYYGFYNSNSSPKIITNDIQKGLGDYNLDAADYQVWRSCWKDLAPDLIITNPPYNQAFDILKNAQKHARAGVILLLRLSFLEPTKKRGKWLQTHPPTFMRVYGSPRPKFTEPSTDTVTTAWMGWIRRDLHLILGGELGYSSYPPFSFAMDWRK